MVLTTPVQMPGLGGILWIMAGVFLLAWSAIAMRQTVFSVFPEHRQKASLVTTGPYRFVRHPMYTAVLLGCGGLVLTHYTWLRLAMFILLVVVLVIKLHFEEKLLAEKFDKYAAYSRKTSRLIPGVY